jgi:hypothetical protein
LKDLNRLLESVKKKGLTFNQGPQSKRGQLNSMTYCLTEFDYCFRKNMELHYKYHSENSYELLSIQAFSYQNIHTNIGGTLDHKLLENFT